MKIIVSSYFLILYLFSFVVKKTKKIYLLAFILGLLLVAFQGKLGPDYFSYIRIYNGEQYIKLWKGYLFLKVIYFFRYIGFSHRALFIFVGVTEFFLLNKIIRELYKKKYIKNKWFFLLSLFIFTNFYRYSFYTLRAIVGSLFFTIYFIFFIEKKYFKALFYLLIGSLFHPSVLFIVFVPMLKNFYYRKYNIFIIIILLLTSFSLSKINLLLKISDYLYRNLGSFSYKYYLKVSEHMNPYRIESYNFRIADIIALIIIIHTVFLYKAINNKKKILFFNISYIIIFFNYLFGIAPIFRRITDMFNLIVCYIYYEILIISKKSIYWKLFSISILLFMTFISIKSIFGFAEPW